MTLLPNQLSLLTDIVDRVSVGIFVVNKQNEIVLWNGYMENYSQTKSRDVVGKNIFESFPDLPKVWLEQKIHNVFVIKNFSFTSWEHRPYLFKFLHNRPITGGIDYMRQNCTFLPLKGDSDEIEYVCITLFDVTDTSIYESMLKNAVRSLAEASNRDGLTNVYNRRFLENTMSKEFARIKRYGGKLSFIIVDLDHFKMVNDTYGHLAGDEILKIASKRISEGLRTTDTLSRYGGEEFAVMLPETPIAGAAILAQRLCDNLSNSPVNYADHSIKVSASLGVAEFEPDMDSHEDIIANADNMLYRSKDNGRNQVTVFYPDPNNSSNRKKKHIPSQPMLDETPANNSALSGAGNQENLLDTGNDIIPVTESDADKSKDSKKTEAEELAETVLTESNNSQESLNTKKISDDPIDDPMVPTAITNEKTSESQHGSSEQIAHQFEPTMTCQETSEQESEIAAKANFEDNFEDDEKKIIYVSIGNK